MKAVILTNDNKKDWVYAPYELKESTRTVPNKENLKVADPRLVQEFKFHTGSEDLYIINFETLTKILINGSQHNFLDLAKALQLANEQNQESPTEVESETKLPDPPDGIEESSSSDRVAFNQENEEYSAYAVADVNFPLDNSSQLDQVIGKLKTYNWYIQNEAVEEVNNIILDKLPQNQSTKDKLFVLGRNLYQAACGGSYAAGDFVKSFKKTIAESLYAANHLAAGMFYEIYFDSRGVFRHNSFKSTFCNELFALQQEPELKDAIFFISKALAPYEPYLLVKPSLNPEIVEVVIGYVTKDIGIFGEVNVIQGIKSKDKSLLKGSEEIFSSFTYEGDRKALEQKISYFFAVPENQINFTYKPDLKNEFSFGLDGNTALGIMGEG